MATHVYFHLVDHHGHRDGHSQLATAMVAHATTLGLTPTTDPNHPQLKFFVSSSTGACSHPTHPTALTVSHSEFLALSAPASPNQNKRSFTTLLDLDWDNTPTPPSKRLRTSNPSSSSSSDSNSGSDTDHDGDQELDDQPGPIDPAAHTVAFTGTFISGSRREVTAKAERLGFKTKPSITSAVTLVVHGQHEGETAKLRGARQRGLLVMSEDDWLANVIAPSTSSVSKNLSAASASPPKLSAVAKPEASRATTTTTTGGEVVFVGTLPSRRTRAQVKDQAVASGFTVKPSLTKNTTVLVYGNGTAAEAKVKEAQGLGIETLSQAEWTQRLTSAASTSTSTPAVAVASASASSASSASASILANVPQVDQADLVRASSAATDATTGALTFGGIAPLVVLTDGQSMSVASASSSSSKGYLVKRTGDSYYCTCPAWRMQKGAAADCRTCKHLKALLGDAYEAARLASVGGGIVPSASSAPAPTGRPKRAVPAKAASTTDTSLNMEVLLAQKWTDKVDPTGWHASEKLDGMRAYWCATRKKLYTRNHNVVNAPDWFVEKFPTDMSLDGELYVGRDMFSATMSIVRGSAADDRWKNVQYQLFDIPSLNKPFEDRLQAMQDLVQELGIDHMQAVPHVVCTGTTHLLDLLATVESKAGEGIMLRKPKSYYAHGRSDTLLKVKTFADGEAVVIGHQLSTSATYFGQLGALECRMASGKVFRVGSGLTADLRDLTKAPPPGTLITYKCQELTKDGVPRFPVFLGVAPPDRTEPSDPVFGGANAGAGDNE